MTDRQESTITEPQTQEATTGVNVEAVSGNDFNLRFMDTQADTLRAALHDYLDKRGEVTAAAAVDTLYILMCYSVNRALYPNNDNPNIRDMGAEALAQMSNLTAKLGGTFHSPSGYN